MKIVVVGGSGRVGSKLVAELDERGHEAVDASLPSGVNTLTGQGLGEVVDGASVVVDVTSSPSFDDPAAMEFFVTSTAHLLAAGAAAGVRHHVVLSIVGSDHLPEVGFYRAKVAQEQLVEESPIPYTIVRSTQFFEFVGQIAELGSDGGGVRLPPLLVQPAATDDVAGALADVAVGPPLNDTVELAGPEVRRLDELARRVLKAIGDPRPVVADPHAPYFGAELSERSLLPRDGARIAPTRFEDWLLRRSP